MNIDYGAQHRSETDDNVIAPDRMSDDGVWTWAVVAEMERKDLPTVLSDLSLRPSHLTGK